MTFAIEIGGRARAVSVHRAGLRTYRVTIDGQPHVIDAVRVGEFGLSLIVDSDAGASRDLHVAHGSTPGELLVVIEGATVAVKVNGRRTGRVAAEIGAQAHGDHAVTAPMPGRVVRVLVGEGDAVTARQGVVVVEAMKMENELRAPRAGRVKEVAVTAGQSVEAGRVLVVVE